MHLVTWPQNKVSKKKKKKKKKKKDWSFLVVQQGKDVALSLQQHMGRCCSTGLIAGPGMCICCGHSQEKKKKELKKNLQNPQSKWETWAQVSG